MQCGMKIKNINQDQKPGGQMSIKSLAEKIIRYRTSIRGQCR